MIKWFPIETVPKDGTEILIKTPKGIVSAWFLNEAPQQEDDGHYEWICFDDTFSLDGEDGTIEAWAPID